MPLHPQTLQSRTHTPPSLPPAHTSGLQCRDLPARVHMLCHMSDLFPALLSQLSVFLVYTLPRVSRGYSPDPVSSKESSQSHWIQLNLSFLHRVKSQTMPNWHTDYFNRNQNFRKSHLAGLFLHVETIKIFLGECPPDQSWKIVLLTKADNRGRRESE